MATDAFLVVAEDFYSIQGEGASAGVPAVFLRLAGCNMKCQGFSYKDPATGDHLGCDTALVWKSGKKEKLSDIIERWKHSGYLDKLSQGAHLVITGGEPLLQQHAVMNFIQNLDAVLSQAVFIEIETNATVVPVPALLERVNQINASPKLAHSGEPYGKRYQESVLRLLSSSPRVMFKFVIAKPEDVEEVDREYREVFEIPCSRIALMPEGGTRLALREKQPWLVELCKEKMFNYSPRLHIDIWDEATGV